MMTDKEKDHYTQKVMILFGLVISLIVGVFALNICYFKKVKQILTEQTYQDLKKENDGTLAVLQTIIQDKLEMLKQFSVSCDLPEGMDIQKWKGNSETFETGGIRLGISDEQGILYYGSNEFRDISASSDYQRALNGTDSISTTAFHDQEDRDGLVLTVPVIRNGQVKGAACLEYTGTELGKYLNYTEISRCGANLVFTKSGKLVASSPGYGNYNTIYDMLKSVVFRDRQSLEQLKKAVDSGGSGYVAFDRNGSRELLYYQPAGIGDWMSASVVKTEGFERTFYRLERLSERFTESSAFLLACSFFLIVCILYLRKKESKRAQKDYLTGVYTRETAKKLVEQGLKAGGKKRFYACMFLDIDDFKKINDTFGHQKGDLVLTQAGKILIECTRQEDVIVRFGGDEFCIWLYGVSGRKQPESIAKRILNAFHVSGTIHASIGITLVGEDETEYDAILKRADQALYQAKRKGKNQFELQL